MKQTDFAICLNRFLTDFLVNKKGCSPKTIDSYRYAFIFLLDYYNEVIGIPADQMTISSLTYERLLGDAKPLPHPQGEIAGFFLPRIRQVHQLQSVPNTVQGRNAQDTVLLLHVFLRSHIHINGRGLHDGPQPSAGTDNFFFVISNSIQCVTSGRRVLKPADQPDQSGLARAVFTHKSID